MAPGAATKRFVTRDDFARHTGIEYGEVPAWEDGTFFRIRSVTAGDMIDWTEANEGEAKRTAALRLITKSVVDEDGNLIFTDKDLPMLRSQSHKRIETLVKAIVAHNGLTAKAQDDAKKG